MSVQIRWDGLDELRTSLRNLPEDLAKQAASVVRASATQAGQETIGAYPVRQTNLHPGYKRKSPWFPPGILRGRVTITDRSTRFSAAYAVKSNAPHAWLFENGNKGKIRYNRNGSARGAMPPAPISEHMIPKVIRIRKQMVEQLKEIVKAAGFEISET